MKDHAVTKGSRAAFPALRTGLRIPVQPPWDLYEEARALRDEARMVRAEFRRVVEEMRLARAAGASPA